MTAVLDDTQVEEENAPDENGLILRPITDATLETVLEEWHRSTSSANVDIDKVDVDLEADQPTIRFGEHEVPSTERGLEALARYLGMPARYVLRVPPDEQQFMFSRRLDRSEEGRVVVEYTSAGIESVIKGGKTTIRPAEIVSKVAEYLPLESPVRDYWCTPADLRLDAYVPDDWDGPHVGGDLKVGDITRGGVRVVQNRKQNLAPGAQTFLYRTVCTNGMEVVNRSLRVDARGKDEHEVLAELGFIVHQAFDAVESTIKHFYDMRTDKIAQDRTGVFRRVALDTGLSERVVGRMENVLASMGDEPSMFDFANLITNQANAHPTTAAARSMQQAGGSLVVDHSARCKTCHKAL